MTVNTPKDPIDGVTEWTNEETGIKYQYIGGAWRAVSSKAAQDVADALGQLDLQKVLDNGNQADKGANFGGDVNIEGKLEADGIKNQGSALFKFGSGQGVVLDSGSTYETMLQLKSYSGPSERKDVFTVNAKGNATLLGKLTLTPGESGNQAATYGQLATLAEQIEQINPTYERGKYNFSQSEVTGSSETRGKYNLFVRTTAVIQLMKGKLVKMRSIFAIGFRMLTRLIVSAITTGAWTTSLLMVQSTHTLTSFQKSNKLNLASTMLTVQNMNGLMQRLVSLSISLTTTMMIILLELLLPLITVQVQSRLMLIKFRQKVKLQAKHASKSLL